MRSTGFVAERSMSFAARLATAFVELVLATAVIIAAIVAGHELREWRDWYPTAYHPWLDAQRAAPEVVEP
jgi:hypothetical protein